MAESSGQMRKSQRYVGLGVALGAIGLLLLWLGAQPGGFLVIVGGMLLFAGLIGEAVRGPDVPREPEDSRRPWERDRTT